MSKYMASKDVRIHDTIRYMNVYVYKTRMYNKGTIRMCIIRYMFIRQLVQLGYKNVLQISTANVQLGYKNVLQISTANVQLGYKNVQLGYKNVQLGYILVLHYVRTCDT